ncbi:MAG: zf-C2H2 Zinc finger, C2H2 type [Sclerophora amabilis]|nr:MAG: zf-C2H2 Zinc finger, C2H2 type [Sclerophora amabilis]
MSFAWKPSVYNVAQMRRPSSVESLRDSNEQWVSLGESSPTEGPSTPSNDRRGSIASSQSWETGLSMYSSDNSTQSPSTPIREHGHNFSPIDLCFPESDDLLNDFTPMRQAQHCTPASGYGYGSWSYPTLSKGLFTSQDTSIVPFPLYDGRDAGSMDTSEQEPFFDVGRRQGLGDGPSPIGDASSSLVAPSSLSTVAPFETYALHLDPESCLQMGMTYARANNALPATPESSIMSQKRSLRSSEALSSSKSMSSMRSKPMRASNVARKRQTTESKSQHCIKDKRMDLLRKGYTFTISKQGTYTCEIEGCKSPPFKREEHKKRHMKTTHSGEKPWKCGAPGCTKDFSRSDNRTQHYKTHVFPKRNAAVPDDHRWWDDKRDTLAKIRREEAEGRL